jgi:hypothetical protein
MCEHPIPHVCQRYIIFAFRTYMIIEIVFQDSFLKKKACIDILGGLVVIVIAKQLIRISHHLYLPLNAGLIQILMSQW